MLRNTLRNSNILFDRWLEHGTKTFNENLRCSEAKDWPKRPQEAFTFENRAG